MSTTNVEHNQLVTCDLCHRRYNINVYKRHRTENQCLKRNHHRLPFESIKQRSIRIGDKLFSVQQQKTKDVQISTHVPISEKISNEEKIPRIFPSNNRRRTLEQAKQLLERRIKYKPPWIQKQNKINVLRANNALDQRKLSFHERPSPPTTKFKSDDLPIKVSDRHIFNRTYSQQPILTYSPMIRTTEASKYRPCQPHRIDRTFSNEQNDSTTRPMRKAYTWTRPSKQSSIRDVISPIQIPTFLESSCGSVQINHNQNYDDDEFERYSPTPPSTPKFQEDKIERKNILPSIKQNFILDEQQTVIRPITYQKAKRSEQQKQNETQIYYHTTQFSSKPTHRKATPSTFHLPPINPTSYPKTKQRLTINPTPWR